jgi:hypothetical protein
MAKYLSHISQTIFEEVDRGEGFHGEVELSVGYATPLADIRMRTVL